MCHLIGSPPGRECAALETGRNRPATDGKMHGAETDKKTVQAGPESVARDLRRELPACFAPVPGLRDLQYTRVRCRQRPCATGGHRALPLHHDVPPAAGPGGVALARAVAHRGPCLSRRGHAGSRHVSVAPPHRRPLRLPQRQHVPAGRKVPAEPLSRRLARALPAQRPDTPGFRFPLE